MINDAFTPVKTKHKGTDVVAMRCKTCNTEFDCCLNLVKPKNCKHQLGRSVEITCPKCFCTGTSWSSYKVSASLDEAADGLKEAYRKYQNTIKDDKLIIDMVNIDRYDLICKACNQVSDLDPDKCIPRESALQCPLCKYEENCKEESYAAIIAFFLCLWLVESAYASKQVNDITE